MKNISRARMTLVLGLLAVLVMPAVSAASDLPLKMKANAGMQTGGRTSIVDISVNKWTPAEEREALIEHMRQPDGSLTLPQALQKLDTKGTIAFAGKLGIKLRYAYEFPKEGGNTIVMVADRPVDVSEASFRGVTQKAFNTTLIVVELDEEGVGAGTLILAAEITFGADGKFEVKNVGQNPVHLGNVRVMGKKK